MDRQMNKKDYMEFRYYDMPQDHPIVVLEGDGWKRNYGHDAMYFHFHNILEIGICHYGKGEMIYETEVKDYTDGMLSVIPRNVPHNTLSKEDSISYWEYLFVDELAYAREIYPNEPVRAEALVERINGRYLLCSKEENPEMEWLIRSIINEYKEKKSHYKTTAKYMVMSLMLLLERGNRVCGGKVLEEGFLHHSSVHTALSYIDKHYMEPMQVWELAEISHISETHFRRLFVQNMHMTPVEYVNLVRVKKACELLKTTSYDMETIAGKTGFQTTSTFNRNFKRMLGVSPYHWKKNNQYLEANNMGINVSAYKGWE